MDRESQKTLNALILLLLSCVFLADITDSYIIEEDPDQSYSNTNELEDCDPCEPSNKDVFYYFGYGSNMLTKRIHINNPTAVSLGAGLLLNYRLDFNHPAESWKGAAATIVPTKDSVVYGTIWELDQKDMKSLDLQEGVPSGVYVPVYLPVIALDDDAVIECRSYHLTQQPETDLRTLTADNTPIERQPSKSYLKTIVKGAIETGLPAGYIKWLRSIKHNNNTVAKFEQQLDLADVVLDS